ncbi:type II secretion system protein XpsI [Xanthomonas sp. 60]
MRRAVRGFTLLEVLVAFALLALALTLLLGTLSGAARQVAEADQRTRAVLLAQSLMAGLGVEAPLQEGTREGRWDDGAYSWTLEVAPYAEPRAGATVGAASAGTVGGPRLLELQLQVRWSEAPRDVLRWRTLRLVPAALERGG